MKRKEQPAGEGTLAFEKYIFPAIMAAGFGGLTFTKLSQAPGEMALFGLAIIAVSLVGRYQAREPLPMDRSAASSRTRMAYWAAGWLIPLAVILVLAGFVGWLLD